MKEIITGESSSKTINQIGDFGENYAQYCFDRLPCGICRKTGEMCPLRSNNWNNQGTNPSYPIYQYMTTPNLTDPIPCDISTAISSKDNQNNITAQNNLHFEE